METYLSFTTNSFAVDPIEKVREIAQEEGYGYIIECLEKGEYWLTCTSASPDLETRLWLLDTPLARWKDENYAWSSEYAKFFLHTR